MAITIDYSDPTPEYVINIPKADMLQVQASPVEVRELDIDTLRQDLGAIQESAEGMWAPTAFFHTPPLTVAGVTLARVVEILAPYVILFEDGSYNVNVVGGNSNVSDVTVKNSVGVNTANSAGLQDSVSLQAASFGGHVTVDTVNGITGTQFPRGTQRTPVNNIADAIVIAEAQGLSRILLIEDITLSSADLTDGYIFYAERAGVVVTIEAAADVTNCSFESVGVTGTLDSNNRFYACEVFDATSLQATIVDCVITGTLTLAGGLTALINCASGVPGSGPGETPEIDMGGSGSNLLARDYSGGLEISNLSDANSDISLDFDSGRLVVASTVTDGTVTARGVLAVIEDNSTGSAVVNDLTLKSDTDRIRKQVENRMRIDKDTGVQTIYEDDGTTVHAQYNLKDDAGVQVTDGEDVYERDPI